MPIPLQQFYRSREKVRKSIGEIAKREDRWNNSFPAIMGNSAGAILTSTSGIVWVRSIITGKEYEVHNDIAPVDRLGLRVMVGTLVGDEKTLRIRYVSPAYGLTITQGSSVVTPTSENQFIGKERLLPLTAIPSDGGGLVVQVYGGIISNPDGTVVLVENQTLDLSSHVPVTGARYVLLEADSNGAICVTDGNTISSPGELLLSDIPPLVNGRYASCAVRLYSGQTQLYRDPDSVNDFVDIRSIPARFVNNGKELVMETGVSNPPVPITNTGATDWIYSS